MELLTSLEPVILGVHVLLCIFLISVILLQAGKGADMGAAFGAGSSQTLFGARGAATLLSKITTAGAILFLLTSISLAAVHKDRSNTGRTDSVLEGVLKDEPEINAENKEQVNTEATPEAVNKEEPKKEEKPQ